MRNAPSSVLPAVLAAAVALSGCAPRESAGSAEFPASFRKGDAYEFPGGYKIRIADFKGRDFPSQEKNAASYVRLLGAAGAVHEKRGRWRESDVSEDDRKYIVTDPVGYDKFRFEGARLGLDGVQPDEKAYMANAYGWKSPEDVASTVTAVLRFADANGDKVLSPGEVLDAVRRTFPGAAK